LTVATVRRYSDLVIVFLQGLGSTKEDYPDAAHEPAFAGRPFLAYDAPGCGETSHEDLPGIFIPFLVKTAQTVPQDTGIQRSALSGIPWVA
jgi:pimeloyl-ACP methyl ester carboxylesterase